MKNGAELDNRQAQMGQAALVALMTDKPETPKLTHKIDAPKISYPGMANNNVQARQGGTAKVHSVCSWRTLEGTRNSGMVTAVGKHGVTVRDGKGKRHKVYHEQLQTVKQPIEKQEYDMAAGDLAKDGVPIAMDERIKRYLIDGGEGKRPNSTQIERLKNLVSHGAPINISEVVKTANAEEAQALIDRYGKLARPKIILRSKK